MKTKIISTVSLATALSLMAIIPVFAQAGDDLSVGNSNGDSNTAAAINAAGRANARMGSTTRSSAGANAQQRIANAQSRGAQEITARITSLNKLLTRIQSMKNLSLSQIASFQSTIQTAVSSMTTLQAKIQSDTSTTSLMADMKSIAPDYRIYLLVEPQLSILSASDRVNTIVGTLKALSSKVQTRLASTTNESNLSALQADLSDMNAKIADAASQAEAAMTEVSGLVPDNGVKSVQLSNTAALKSARSNIQTATKDIQAAYKDAQAIVKGVKGTKNHTATTTAQ